MMTKIDEFLANWKAKAMEFYGPYHKALTILELEAWRAHEALKVAKAAILEPARAKFNAKMDELDKMEVSYESRAYWTAIQAERDAENVKMEPYWAAYQSTQKALQDWIKANQSVIIWNSKVTLEAALDREVANRKAKLIARVEAKAGKIVDAGGLYMGHNRELNGLIIGEKKAVYVETIYAGGYNIQCLHYRVLVK